MKGNKPWYKSRLCWSGVLKLSAGIILILANYFAGELSTEEVGTGIISAVWGLVDFFLRVDTHKDVSFPMPALLSRKK